MSSSIEEEIEKEVRQMETHLLTKARDHVTILIDQLNTISEKKQYIEKTNKILVLLYEKLSMLEELYDKLNEEKKVFNKAFLRNNSKDEVEEFRKLDRDIQKCDIKITELKRMESQIIEEETASAFGFHERELEYSKEKLKYLEEKISLDRRRDSITRVINKKRLSRNPRLWKNIYDITEEYLCLRKKDEYPVEDKILDVSRRIVNNSQRILTSLNEIQDLLDEYTSKRGPQIFSLDDLKGDGVVDEIAYFSIGKMEVFFQGFSRPV